MKPVSKSKRNWAILVLVEGVPIKVAKVDLKPYVGLPMLDLVHVIKGQEFSSSAFGTYTHFYEIPKFWVPLPTKAIPPQFTLWIELGGLDDPYV